MKARKSAPRGAFFMAENLSRFPVARPPSRPDWRRRGRSTPRDAGRRTNPASALSPSAASCTHRHRRCSIRPRGNSARRALLQRCRTAAKSLRALWPPAPVTPPRHRQNAPGRRRSRTGGASRRWQIPAIAALLPAVWRRRGYRCPPVARGRSRNQ